MKIIVLFVMMFFSNGDSRLLEYQMPNMETCVQVLKQSKLEMPQTDEGHEGMAAMSCGIIDRKPKNSMLRR